MRQVEPVSLHRSFDAAEALVDGFHRLHGGVEDAGVSHHVAAGEVADDGVELARLDRTDEPVGYLAGRHGRGEVVGGHRGRRHQYAAFPANGASLPPEKKNVTWAYFSVSAMRS